jgi:histone H3/H4
MDKKAQTQSDKTETKTKKHSTDMSRLDTFIYRVLRHEHPTTGMTGDSLSTMNNLVHILFCKIATALNRLMRNADRKTISSREVSCAIRLSLSGELQKETIKICGEKLTAYTSAKAWRVENKSKDKKPVSRSAMSGLLFPVTRIQTLLMNMTTANRKSDTAAVCLTSALEHICAKILLLSGTIAQQTHKKRITTRHIMLSIHDDLDLSRLYCNTILSGGVVAEIHPHLEKKKEGAKEEKEEKKRKKRKKEKKDKKEDKKKIVAKKEEKGKKQTSIKKKTKQTK